MVERCTGLRWKRVVLAAGSAPSVLSGELAQLARAPALQAGGQRFESVILHFPVRREKLEERRFKRELEYQLAAYRFVVILASS